MEILGVNIGEDARALAGFRDEFAIPFPLLLDPEEGAQKVLGVRGHPSTVLIDRQGRILGRILGERDWQSEPARRLVRSLLEGGE